jgi:uncharacterized membrane protein YgaE (UPF0421/DUF939 family)
MITVAELERKIWHEEYFLALSKNTDIRIKKHLKEYPNDWAYVWLQRRIAKTSARIQYQREQRLIRLKTRLHWTNTIINEMINIDRIRG